VNDQFLDVFLIAGEYTVVLGGNATWIEDIDTGSSLSLLSGLSGTGIPTHGQYQLDVYGNVAAVPTPGVVSLLALGGIGATGEDGKP